MFLIILCYYDNNKHVKQINLTIEKLASRFGATA